jgi:hypothetical protein
MGRIGGTGDARVQSMHRSNKNNKLFTESTSLFNSGGGKYKRKLFT